MRKIILSLVMLVAASCAFGQDAEYLIKQYRKVKGAEYENMTKTIKKAAKKDKYINPKYYDLLSRVKKIEYLTVKLNENEREALTKNLENIDGFNNLFAKKNNVESLFNKNFSLFKNIQYFGIEENGIVKEVIVRIDAMKDDDIMTVIIHVEGEITLEEMMKMVDFSENKTVTIQD